MNLIEHYRAWRQHRRWPAELQLYYLRGQVEEDARWMAHDPKIAALCQRYAGMLADDWMHQERQSTDNFRASIGCDPQIVLAEPDAEIAALRTALIASRQRGDEAIQLARRALDLVTTAALS